MKNKTATIPDEAIHTLARCLLPEVVKYFESEQGKGVRRVEGETKKIR